MQCVLFWKVSLVETTLLTSKQPDIVTRGFICTYLRCMKYFFSWCMKYFYSCCVKYSGALRAAGKYLTVAHLIFAVSCLLLLASWLSSGRQWAIILACKHRVEKLANFFQKLTKLDQVHCAWLITWVVRKRNYSRTPAIVKGNKSLYLVWFKWGSQLWGILKHFSQSRCIIISHWSREKKQSSFII